MSSPLELHVTFSHLGKNYDIHLQRGKKSDYSVQMNGMSYAVLGDQEKVDAACKILKSVSLDSITSVDDLKGRLSVLKDISFPTQNTHAVGKRTLEKSSLRNRELDELVLMVRHISSDADMHEVCRACLAQNNNHTKLALATLRNAFREAGAGAPSARITRMLKKEASDRNVDEIRAFGRKKTVDVAQFLKALPLTENGAIDLTKMKKIGQGGTQDVFVLQDGTAPYVLKVNRASLKMDNDERAEKYKTYNAAYQALHQSFGDHCTVEQLLLRDIVDASGAKKAIISVADFETGFQNESKLGLQASDFEWSEVTIAKNLKAYDDMLKSVLFHENAPSFDLGALEALNPNVAKLANLIRQEPGFGEALKEFLTEFREYFNKTGQYLDIAGRDNIIFFKEGDKWTFKLGTVIKMETAEKFEEALNWLHNGSQETKDSENHTWMLKYCFHWTKTLNTLAKMVGMDNVISDPNIVTRWSDLEKGEITGKPLNPERLLNILHAVENYPAERLVHEFNALGVDPQKETDVLIAILSDASSDKKMAIAEYLHQRLPRVPENPDADNREHFKFCPDRCRIAEEIAKIAECKALALEFYEEVMKDPRAPHEEVRKAMSELS